MKLEELNNEYKNGDGEVKKIIPLGYVGSNELCNTAAQRLGSHGLYVLRHDGWNRFSNGYSHKCFYGIEERDKLLFEAYDHLEEGWEMIGYGDNSVVESGYKYSFYDTRTNSFFKFPHLNLIPDQIYARRKKEEKPISILPDIEETELKTRNIVVGAQTYARIECICNSEHKTISEKIDEWLDFDKAQEKVKRSRAEVMRDIKKELEDAWSEEEHPGVNTREASEMAGSLFEIITEGGMKFK